MSVGEFKANFSEALERVKTGEEIEVLYGRTKRPVAKLIPFEQPKRGGLLGCLEGVATFTMSDDWKMTPEELLNL
jgi:antitoxin (DNA-binding transcriptional repressor) of toxin-antitoxin stability system